MERELNLKKSREEEKNKSGFPVPLPRPNGTKPAQIERKPECEKKHITRDGKRRQN